MTAHQACGRISPVKIRPDHYQTVTEQSRHWLSLSMEHRFEDESTELTKPGSCPDVPPNRCFWLAAQGEQNTKDAAMVKWLAPKIATEVIHESLVLHSHYGYSRDFGIEKRLRDTIGLEVGDGTPQTQKLVITRETFRSEYLPY